MPGERPRERDTRDTFVLVAALESELHSPGASMARVEELLDRLEAIGDRHEHVDLLATVIHTYAQRARALAERARTEDLIDVRAPMRALLAECFGPGFV